MLDTADTNVSESRELGTDTLHDILEFTKFPGLYPRSKYFYVGTFSIYIRNTKIYFPSKQVHALVISNITNDDVSSRGNGLLRRMLDELESCRVVSFECVHNNRLRKFLHKRGYSCIDSDSHSYILLPASDNT